MTEPVSKEDLMRYMDGEMPPEQRARLDAELARSTELKRELAIFRAMRTDFQGLSFDPGTYHKSVWDQVNASVTRPIGWILITVGVIVWTAYGAYVFTTSPANPWEKLATGAIVIGILTLLASVIWDRYREWGTDPYKDVHR
ncbi:MAG TPA: hypothetical protein EYQ27_14975 [Gemmatimonadetes bacterium]|nr:hypothetical protein [Gemmatimonadota bacterium]